MWMQIKKQGFRGSRSLPGYDARLSTEARKRLKWMDYYDGRGGNAALTCRYFGISRQTFYEWRKRYDHDDPSSLEGRSHRPRRVRRPTWTRDLSEAVLALRERYPRWGKDKLAVLLSGDGWTVSTSMVGRILGSLKRSGVLAEAPARRISARKRPRPRPYAVRKPKEYEVREPGDLVEVDTLDVRPLPDEKIKHFTGRDVISRWDVLEAHERATARTASVFLDALQGRTPFPIKAIQVDGGSEFEAEFEEECRRRGIRLFILPPRSPKLNGHVERAQRTHTEEFYEVYDGPLRIEALNRRLKKWEDVYNTIRPHQSLGYKTPGQAVEEWKRRNQEASP